MELAQRAQEAPCTHFMPDIARSVLRYLCLHFFEVSAHLDLERALRLMNELLWYAQSEAGHPIFRLMRDMGREANALEGKIQALRVLMEVSFSVVS